MILFIHLRNETETHLCIKDLASKKTGKATAPMQFNF